MILYIIANQATIPKILIKIKNIFHILSQADLKQLDPT